MVALLALLNIGGVIVIVFNLGRGDGGIWGTLAWLLFLDAVGFWLLRQMRE